MNVLQTIQHQLPPADKIIVALSGGVDSLVLAHLLKNLGYKLILAHFNHGWRGRESDADQAFVEKLAKDWNLPLEIAKSKKPTQGNAEDHARRERYLFLEAVRQKHQAQWIVTAHHRDDQIETLLMHQERGAGLRGLAGMPFQRGSTLRPLLEMSKSDLIDYANTHHLNWREDQSNQDLHYTRNHLRHVEIPKLKAKDPNFEKNLLQKSGEARQKLGKLEKNAQKWIKNHLKNKTFNYKAFSKLSDELQSELLIQFLGPVDLYQPTLTRLKQWIITGHSGSKITVKGQTFWREHDSIYMESKNAPKIPLKKVKLNQKAIQWGPWSIQNLSDETFFVRPWQSGDRFQPSGMKGSKKVQDFFVDAKIPLHQRKSIPLILNEKNDIICIANLRFSQEYLHLKTKLKIHKNENI